MKKGTIQNERVIIIGGGPAGLSAALYLARAGLRPLVFAGSPPGGQLMLTSEVENFPGHQSILGSQLIQHMRQQATSFGARIEDENITSLISSEKGFVVDAAKKQYGSDSVLIATGASALWLGLESEKRLRGRGVSACATCDGFFFKGKRVAVIGGGDTALEEALTLAKFAKEVVIVHRRGEFRASKIMQDRVRRNSQIHLVMNAEVAEISGTERVTGLKLLISPSDKTLLTKSVAELDAILPRQLGGQVLSNDSQKIAVSFPVDGVFVAIGHRPDTDLFKAMVERDEKGYIINAHMKAMRIAQGKDVSGKGFNFTHQTMTNVSGLFAAGDCVDHVYRQASTAAGAGVAASLDIERWLEEHDK